MDKNSFWECHIFDERPDPQLRRLFGRREAALKWLIETLKGSSGLYNGTLWSKPFRDFGIFYKNGKGEIVQVNTLFFLSREQAAKLYLDERGRVCGVPSNLRNL